MRRRRWRLESILVKNITLLFLRGGYKGKYLSLMKSWLRLAEYGWELQQTKVYAIETVMAPFDAVNNVPTNVVVPKYTFPWYIVITKWVVGEIPFSFEPAFRCNFILLTTLKFGLCYEFFPLWWDQFVSGLVSSLVPPCFRWLIFYLRIRIPSRVAC